MIVVRTAPPLPLEYQFVVYCYFISPCRLLRHPTPIPRTHPTILPCLNAIRTKLGAITILTYRRPQSPLVVTSLSPLLYL